MVNHPDNVYQSRHVSEDSVKELNDPEFIEGPWFVYICESQAKHYYVGITTNVRKRLAKHNSGNGSKMARDQGEFRLVYVSDEFPDKSTARKREIQLKKWSREKKKKLINGSWK